MGVKGRTHMQAYGLWALACAMTAGAGSLLTTTRLAHARPLVSGVHVTWPVLTIGFALTAIYAVHLQFRGESHAITLEEIVLVVGLFTVTPREVVAAQVIGAFAVLGCYRRLRPLKVAFNVAQIGLGASLGILVFRAIDPVATPSSVTSWVAALAGCVTACVVGLTAVAVAIAVTEGRANARAIAHSVVAGLIGTVANTMLGLVAVIVLAQSPLGALLLAGPVAVVFFSYRAYISEREKSAALEFLYAASERLNNARDIEDGLVELLDFARDTFHSDLAQIVLTGERDDTAFSTSVGPGPSACKLASVPNDAVVAIIAAAAETNEAALLGAPVAAMLVREFACGSALVAPLLDESGLRGAVVVGRDRDAAEPFAKEDVRLFETFANHLGTTLEKARLTTSLARLREAERELAYRAYHDALTGLANRALFRDRVDSALVEAAGTGTEVGVMFIDLDDFKTVNDTMGHAAGDALLVEVGRRLARCIGGPDTAARIGGDEFAVLLRQVSHPSQVNLVANSILAALREPIEVDDQPVVCRASVGIALDCGSIEAAELMQRADVAMYSAKRNGKGRFDEYEPSMTLNVAHRHEVKVGLERAVGAQEFVVEYQPVAVAATGAILGTEALVRWRQPSGSLTAPSEFVGVAEETGLIVPIGREVLREACRQGAEWTRRNPSLRMFVNLSARQLAHPDIVHDVALALRSSGLDASRLVLEVTETAMMRDIDEAVATLDALRRLGVRIAIDDFGTGFSSLSYLRQLPIDMLKIAKPIVDLICETPQDTAFVKGVIELGHVVGLTVVAEGVECVEQYAHLVEMGCDLVQGFYYAPSMKPERIDELLARDALLLGA